MVTSLFKKAVVIFLFCSQSGQSFYESCSKLCVLTLKRLYFGKIYSKLCGLAKMVFFLGIAGKNSRFCQNSWTYRDSVMVIFRFLGQNRLKIELRTFAVQKILMEH